MGPETLTTPAIQEVGIINSKDFKVVEVLDTGYGEVALVMPRKPGGGSIVGFNMMLMKVREDNTVSSNEKDHLYLRFYGAIGFEASYSVRENTKGSRLFFLEDSERLSEYYEDETYGDTIRKLKEAVDRNREAVTQENPTQEAWEAVAKDIAPTLAKLFILAEDK